LNQGQPGQKAGVLILLFPANDQLCTVFIKRTEYDGEHSGQISFPGGKFERSDQSLDMTALREAEEEIGIRDSEVEIIGELTPLPIPVSNIEVFPYIGVMDNEPLFKPDPSEVEYIIKAGIKTLLDPGTLSKKEMLLFNDIITVPYFNIEENHIWGATAMILGEFLEVLRNAGFNREIK
jgi:8-oxo-dGTP pyrophosphatase MutT (NUDIX family)